MCSAEVRSMSRSGGTDTIQATGPRGRRGQLSAPGHPHRAGLRAAPYPTCREVNSPPRWPVGSPSSPATWLAISRTSPAGSPRKLTPCPNQPPSPAVAAGPVGAAVEEAPAPALVPVPAAPALALAAAAEIDGYQSRTGTSAAQAVLSTWQKEPPVASRAVPFSEGPKRQ